MIRIITAVMLAACSAANAGLQRTWGDQQSAAEYLKTYVEPKTHGQAAVTLYEDDRLCAFYVRIDGNWMKDHTYWMQVNKDFRMPVSFVLVSHDIGVKPAWSPWDSVRVLLAKGNDIGSHSAYHNPYDRHASGELNLYIEYHDSRERIEQKLPGHSCKSFAGPGGGWPNDGDSVRMYYNLSSTGSISYSTDIFKIRSMVDRTLNPSDQWYREHIQFVSHNVYSSQANMDEIRNVLTFITHNRDKFWLPRRTDLGMYGAERKTHRLNVASVTASEISMTLSDDMHDGIFNYPLTVKVCVNSTWTNAAATQDGRNIPWFFKNENGRKYVLLKAVPDRGTILLNSAGGTGGGDPGDPVDPVDPVDTTGGGSVAVGGITVSASSDDGNGPENTLDNDMGTRWSSEGDGEWILYDLGGVASLNGISIAFFKGNERTTSFDVSVSQNGSSWTRALSSMVSSGSSIAFETFAFGRTFDARYVKITGHGNSVNAWTSLTEVRMDEAPQTSPVRIEMIRDAVRPGAVRLFSLDGTRFSGSGSNVVPYIIYDPAEGILRKGLKVNR